MAAGREGGDRKTFADLFEAHREDVVRLAYLLSGDAEVAKDAAAEAFVRTYEQWRRGKVDRVEGYVRRAVVNAVKNDFRRRGRQRRFEDRRFGDGRGAPAHTERADASDEVWQLIRQLPQRQRTVVVLRYWEDQPIAVIAEVMGCPPGTVKSLLSRGMARLREATEQEAMRQEAVCDDR